LGAEVGGRNGLSGRGKGCQVENKNQTAKFHCL
jgi:hypothetical protein